jgi:hypothetical protein
MLPGRFGLEMPPLGATMSAEPQVFEGKLILIMASAAAAIQSGDKNTTPGASP